MATARQCQGTGDGSRGCQQILSDKSKFCPSCGTPVQPILPNPVYTWPCQHQNEDGNICRGELKASNKFCGQCGTKVESPLCRHCLATMDKIGNFCPYCGQTLMVATAKDQEKDLIPSSAPLTDSQNGTFQTLSLLNQIDEDIARELQEKLDHQVAAQLSKESSSIHAPTALPTETDDDVSEVASLFQHLEVDEEMARKLQEKLDHEDAAQLSTDSSTTYASKALPTDTDDDVSEVARLFQHLEVDEEMARKLQETLDHEDTAHLGTESSTTHAPTALPTDTDDDVSEVASLFQHLEVDEEMARKLQEMLDHEDTAHLGTESSTTQAPTAIALDTDDDVSEVISLFQHLEVDEEMARKLQENMDHQDAVHMETESLTTLMPEALTDDDDDDDDYYEDCLTHLKNDELVARKLQEDLDLQSAAQLAPKINKPDKSNDKDTQLQNDELLARHYQENLDEHGATFLYRREHGKGRGHGASEGRNLGLVYQAESDREVARQYQEDLDHQEALALAEAQRSPQLHDGQMVHEATMMHMYQGLGMGAVGGVLPSEILDGNDYEDLLALEDQSGEVAPKAGLSQDQINQLPVATYTAKTPKTSDTLCHVCMSQFERGEKLRSLTCMHSFHCDCIDPWIKGNPTCPICRINIEVWYNAEQQLNV